MVWFLFRFVVINLSLLNRFRTFRRIKMVLRHVQYLFCNSWDALWPCVRYVRVRVCRVQAACVRVRGASGAKQFKSFFFHSIGVVALRVTRKLLFSARTALLEFPPLFITGCAWTRTGWIGLKVARCALQLKQLRYSLTLFTFDEYNWVWSATSKKNNKM